MYVISVVPPGGRMKETRTLGHLFTGGVGGKPSVIASLLCSPVGVGSTGHLVPKFWPSLHLHPGHESVCEIPGVEGAWQSALPDLSEEQEWGTFPR